MKLHSTSITLRDTGVEVSRVIWVAQSEDFPVAAQGETASDAATALREALNQYLKLKKNDA